jgi:hypothetical protein
MRKPRIQDCMEILSDPVVAIIFKINSTTQSTNVKNLGHVQKVSATNFIWADGEALVRVDCFL